MKVLAAVRVVVPDPLWVTFPLPEIRPANVTVSLLSKAKVALLITKAGWFEELLIRIPVPVIVKV